MKFVAASLLSTLSMNAFADEGTNAALKVCEGLFSHGAECLKAVQGKRFDVNAVAVCKSAFVATDAIKCLDSIANQFYQVDALNVCKSGFTQNDKLDCMAEIARKSFVPEAVAFCNSMFIMGEKKRCLSIVADKYVAPEAVKICSKQFTSADKIKCIEGAAVPLEKSPTPKGHCSKKNILSLSDRTYSFVDNNDIRALDAVKALQRVLRACLPEDR